eukprot:TRINITY_DN6002_c1_g1_i1.p1 TRINITY_DN6002_c1_g1~~TRINITY_DN6002_c1_g1_i1.p1  ORF type:complete len:327 (+),score=62.84 TRINITY_DN6002_c1_g1_i1:56-1036(+)
MNAFWKTLGLEGMLSRERSVKHEFDELGYSDAYEMLSVVERLDEALRLSRRDHKFIFCVTVAPGHEDHETFMQQLCTPSVIDIASKEYITLILSTRNFKGIMHGWSFGVNTYPHMCIIYAQTPTKWTLLTRVDAPKSGAVMANCLIQCQETAGSLLISQRADTQESEARRRLQEEQDEALREAERIDAENAERRSREEREAREKQEAEEREAALARQRAEDEAAKLYQLKEEKAAALGPEPDPSEPNLSKLRVQLFDGTSAERRFRQTDTIEMVENFIYTLPAYDNTKKKFTVSTTLPVKVLSSSATLKEEQLYPRAVVVAKEELN